MLLSSSKQFSLDSSRLETLSEGNLCETLNFRIRSLKYKACGFNVASFDLYLNMDCVDLIRYVTTL